MILLRKHVFTGGPKPSKSAKIRHKIKIYWRPTDGLGPSLNHSSVNFVAAKTAKNDKDGITGGLNRHYPKLAFKYSLTAQTACNKVWHGSFLVFFFLSRLQLFNYYFIKVEIIL
jgi:hypothetical protein